MLELCTWACLQDISCWVCSGIKGTSLCCSPLLMTDSVFHHFAFQPHCFKDLRSAKDRLCPLWIQDCCSPFEEISFCMHQHKICMFPDRRVPARQHTGAVCSGLFCTSTCVHAHEAQSSRYLTQLLCFLFAACKCDLNVLKTYPLSLTPGSNAIRYLQHSISFYNNSCSQTILNVWCRYLQRIGWMTPILRLALRTLPPALAFPFQHSHQHLLHTPCSPSVSVQSPALFLFGFLRIS